MNNHKKLAENGDPDYKSYNTARENHQEEEIRQKVKILTETIEARFNEEILNRQNEVENIEIRLFQAKKLLHLVQYTAIRSYYDKKELEYTSDAASTSEGNKGADVLEQQSRLHPAVKKLMAGNRSHPILPHGRRRTQTRMSASKRPPLTRPDPEPVPKKVARSMDSEVQAEAEARTSNNLFCTLEELDLLNKSRTRRKHVIIVGNVSERMPSTEDHGMSHKWMVYVRGPKEKADLSHIIEKTVFHLHSSYKPHDVVEVCGPKFHLLRRGWGEFPIKITLYFKNSKNKPIELVHNIKLNQTFTGRQTLGRETKFDLLLYDDSNETASDIDNDEKIEELDLETTENVSSTSVEHDYCFGNSVADEEQPDEEIKTDHNYCILPWKEGRVEKPPTESVNKIKQDWNNKLIYGLEYDYDKPLGQGIKTKMTLSSLSNHLESGKGIKINNNQVQIVNENFNGVVLMSDFYKAKQLNNCKLSENGNFKIKLPHNKFKNMGEALSYMFKRLPVVSELANNPSYKRFYPFTCASAEEYSKWNVGKQRSAEWARAKMIKHILVTEQIHKANEWTTKSVMMYGRSHQYTNVPQYKLFNRESEEKNRLLTCYSTSDPNYQKPSLDEWVKNEVNDVNIIDIFENDAPPKRMERMEVHEDSSDPNYFNEYSFIRHTALDSGVILRAEEIAEGVEFNGAERMIFEATKCLVENLIRRAANHRICQGNYDPSTSVINRSNIQMAIDERPELSSISRFRKERERMRQFFKH